MNPDKRREIIFLFLLVLIGFVLRFYTFDQRSLWVDEIHTFNDSRDDLKGQINFYKETPTYLHPPLFFVLTHLFHPFTSPERDLRILPLMFGTLSIPMIYLVSGLFSPLIALPCTFSLTFMTYHISLSQDGRSYSFLMFIGMASLFFFLRYLKTLKKRFLIPVAVLYAILFHTSYSSIPFILFSQLLWFYRRDAESKKPDVSAFFLLSGLTLLFCLPWILFIILHYRGEPVMDPFHTESPGSLGSMVYSLFHDWVPRFPLMVVSALLLVLLPFFSKPKKNALVLLAVFILPVGGLFLFCTLFDLAHFVTSRYFINFLPFFFISIYLSLDGIEIKFQGLKGFLRLKLLFLILLIATNVVILPLYYRSEKQDFRTLVTFLKEQLRGGDKVFVEDVSSMVGILHYFKQYPQNRHYKVSTLNDRAGEIVLVKPFVYQNRPFVLLSSKACCAQYREDGTRLWLIVGKNTAKKMKEDSPSVLKGYFDGTFLNYNKFPLDASMYLFLWDPQSPEEKRIDLSIE